MNFFEHQRLAKKHSQRLIVVFILAVLLLILVTSLAALILTRANGLCTEFDSALWGFAFCQWEIKVLWVSSLCVGLLVVGGSLLKFSELRSDPDAIAKAMGATLIEPNNHEHLNKRLLNVVEEMAIASGVTVPRVYVLKGDFSLNAFAAGHDLQHSLIGVTEGLLRSLNREELQAVIAHEFSHIVHGDMNLNRQLIVAVHGISMISMFGAHLIRHGSRTRYYHSSSRSRDRNGANALWIFALCIFVVGYLGLLISRVLKASISRQREFLADASAVQFTRNPLALSQCFKKIWALGDQQVMEDKSRELYSHMFFANSFFKGFQQFFSTHPPLDERIRRVEPSFNRKNFERQELKTLGLELNKALAGEIGTQSRGSTQSVSAFSEQPSKRRHSRVAENLGAINDESIDKATRLRSSVAKVFDRRISDPKEAQVLLEALFLSESSQVRTTQLMVLYPEQVEKRKELTQAYALMEPFSIEQKNILLELSIATLKHYLTRPEEFLSELQQLISAKKERCLDDFLSFEYVRSSLLPPQKRTKFFTMRDAPEEIAQFISLVAHLATNDKEQVPVLKAQALEKLGLKNQWPDLEAPNGQGIRNALRSLHKISQLRERERLLNVCLEMVHQDEQVTATELRLIRLLCAVMGVSLPLCVQ